MVPQAGAAAFYLNTIHLDKGGVGGLSICSKALIFEESAYRTTSKIFFFSALKYIYLTKDSLIIYEDCLQINSKKAKDIFKLAKTYEQTVKFTSNHGNTN